MYYGMSILWCILTSACQANSFDQVLTRKDQRKLKEDKAKSKKEEQAAKKETKAAEQAAAKIAKKEAKAAEKAAQKAAKEEEKKAKKKAEKEAALERHAREIKEMRRLEGEEVEEKDGVVTRTSRATTTYFVTDAEGVSISSHC